MFQREPTAESVNIFKKLFFSSSLLDLKVRCQAVSILSSLLYYKRINFDINQLTNCLLETYSNYKEKRYFGDSKIHFIKLRIFQTLHLLIRNFTKNQLNDLNNWLIKCLINESQQPSIIILIQWLIVRIYCKLHQEELGVELILDFIANTKGTSSCHLFPIIFHLIKNKNVDITTVEKCFESLLVYCMGQQFNVRFSAQTALKNIFEIYKNDLSEKYSLFNKIVEQVLSQTEKTTNILTYYDLEVSIQTIFYNIPRLTNVLHTEWLSYEYFKRVINIRLVSNEELSIILPTKLQDQSEIGTNSEGTIVQMKIDPSSDVKKSNSNGCLIVVANFIDKAPNLGGLSRTCEVFGVKECILNNLQIVVNKEFQSLSMSSEKWLNTTEVKTENLANYLKDMKKEGFKIVGAEQTSDSKNLNNFQFNEKTILVLGNEKEGIPSNFISLLDDCVQIPQLGQTRSLNVHVAAALFVWEYAKQHSI